MEGDRRGGLVRSIQALYDVGTLAGLDDAELLSRFLVDGAESDAAFEAIVARHAAMVHDVCRALAGSEADAEDAFQAVFLVLASRGSRVRSRGSLGSWLFGVSRRVALRARANAARRRIREREAAARRPTTWEPASESTADAVSILVEEVDCLPSRYRDPVVLCHLQGLTYEAAARRLGCPLGTLSVRLKRAKERLRGRLERRGVTTGSTLVALPRLTVPTGLVERTSRLASLSSSLGPGVPASVLSLTQGALRTMRIPELAASAVLILTLAVGVWTVRTFAQEESPAPAAPAPADEESKTYRLTGRVSDHDTGEPVADVEVSTQYYDPATNEHAIKSTRSGEDGVYSLELPSGHFYGSWITVPDGLWLGFQGNPHGAFGLSDAEPIARRDYLVQRGGPWEFRLVGDATSSILSWTGGVEFDPDAKLVAFNLVQGGGPLRIGFPFGVGEAHGQVDFHDTRLFTRYDDPNPPRFKVRWADRFRPDAVRSINRLDGGSNLFWINDVEGRAALFEDVQAGRFEPVVEDGRLVIRVQYGAPVVKPLPEMVGTVVDPASKPVAGATVEIAYYHEGNGSGGTIGKNERCRTTTDSEGRFRLIDAPWYWFEPDGTSPLHSIRLVAAKEGRAGAVSEPLLAFDLEHPSVQAPPLVLTPACSAMGRVVGSDDRPIIGADVGPTDGVLSLQGRRFRTDADGRFTIQGLPEGPTRLRVHYGDVSASATLQAAREPEPATIHLPTPPSSGPLPPFFQPPQSLDDGR